ncbi:hypothetical protein D3C81_1107610 [compost metagenome]
MLRPSLTTPFTNRSPRTNPTQGCDLHHPHIAHRSALLASRVETFTSGLWHSSRTAATGESQPRGSHDDASPCRSAAVCRHHQSRDRTSFRTVQLQPGLGPGCAVECRRSTPRPATRVVPALLPASVSTVPRHPGRHAGSHRPRAEPLVEPATRCNAGRRTSAHAAQLGRDGLVCRRWFCQPGGRRRTPARRERRCGAQAAGHQHPRCGRPAGCADPPGLSRRTTRQCTVRGSHSPGIDALRRLCAGSDNGHVEGRQHRRLRAHQLCLRRAALPGPWRE